MSYTARSSCLFVVILYSFTRLPYLGWETQDYPNPEKEKERRRRTESTLLFNGGSRCCVEVLDCSCFQFFYIYYWRICVMESILQGSYRWWWIVMDREYYILSYTCIYINNTPSPGVKNGTRGVVCVCVCSFRFCLLSLGFGCCVLVVASLVAWAYHLWGCWEQKETNDILNSRWFELVSIPHWNGECNKSSLDSWLISIPSLELRC